MLRQLYSILLLLAVPFIILRLLIKSIATPAYRQRVGERFAQFKLPAGWHEQNTGTKVVWIHAVSVGEAVAAAPLVRALQEQTDNRLVITTTTPTGSERIQALFGDTVFHVYAPYDLGFVMQRFLNRINPQLLILMETELWPNMLHHSRQTGTRTLLANARLSEKSADGYRRFPKTTHGMLRNIDHIAAQADADAQRFIALGAEPGKVSVTGSLKFHVGIDAETVTTDGLLQSVKASARPVIIAASTREGEEPKVLTAFQTVMHDAQRPLLLLVPRHPERFDKIAKLCTDQGMSVQRRSTANNLEESTDILLGDSMGEMLAYYQIADIAFVGGSLVDTGCQNVLEPAATGLPIVVGPSQFNFATICNQLEKAGALQTVADTAGLGTALERLLSDPVLRTRMGDAGREMVNSNRQALPQLLRLIAAQID